LRAQRVVKKNFSIEEEEEEMAIMSREIAIGHIED